MGRKKSDKTATVAAATEKLPVQRAPETFDFTTQWKERLSRCIKEKGLNYRRTAIAANLNQSTVRNILETERSTGIETLAAIADALGTSVHYLITGRVPLEAPSPGNGEMDSGYQMVPVIALDEVRAYLEGDKTVIERMEVTEAIQPRDGRFRTTMRGDSMTGIAENGNVLDCSTGYPVDPQDVVVVYKAKLKQTLIRTIIPEEWDRDGQILTGRLRPENKMWPEIAFSAKDGDILIAVVFDVIRPLKAVRRARPH